MEIYNGIEQMREETASKLIEAFNNVSINTDLFTKQVNELVKSNLSTIEIKLQIKYVELTIKVENSSFLTRWFWKNKLEKHSLKMKQFSDWLIEINKI